MSGHEQETDLQDSTPGSTGPDRAEGGMGVSSERTGHAGPGQDTTDGVRDTSPHEREPGEPTLPEQAAGGTEDNPDGLEPKAGYSSQDPRSDS